MFTVIHVSYAVVHISAIVLMIALVSRSVIHDLSQIIEAFGQQNNYFTRKLKNELSIVSTVHINPGSTIPAFKIRDIHNKACSDKSLRGEYLFISFRAAWCKPCIEESPLFEDAFVRSQGESVKFVNLSIDSDKEQWDTLRREIIDGLDRRMGGG